MSVIIEPSDQLEFHRPFTRVVKESIHVKNPGAEPVIFKVKTTAPKQYCVRPNAGRIEPNSEIEVQIILQPFKDELPEDFKCKDKFLVQTAPVSAAFEQSDITSMWSHVETNERASMHQHKLRCAFVGPREETRELTETTQASIPEPVTTADGIASSTVTHSEPLQQQPPAIPSHHHDHTTEEPLKENIASAVNAPAPIVAAAATAGAISTPTTTTTTSREISSEAPAPISPAVPSHSTIAAPVVETAAPAPVSLNTASITEPMTPSSASAVTTSHPATSSSSGFTAAPVPEKELKEALEKIARLEKQLNDLRKEEGLRARNQTGTSSRKLASTVQPLDAVHQHLAALEEPRPTEGYPPQVVLGVAIFAFLFAYLFF
ncbi:PapD-like protein [Mucor lusitanicus]|uniref:PapD-like protein n=1 Tax=Mucor circinelloides f. lusitanicus TaxID=29924 RepID=A0A8H4F0B5_MUCCL|nr:PapD-like protein [Mucor lusitanicus]